MGLKFFSCALAEELLTRTRFFRAGLFGRSAGLSRPDAVGREDSELVLHPRTQVNDGGHQLLPSEQLGNWETSQKQQF